jgi:hypothetical protein
VGARARAARASIPTKEAGMKAGLLVCAVLGALAVVASAGAAEAQKIPLVEVQTSFVGTGGWNANSFPSVGQGFIATSDLYRWKGRVRGAWAGTLNAHCTFVTVDTTQFAFKALCSASANLAGGRISVSGLYYGSGSQIPIVGGTGVYTGAKGYVRLVDLGGDNSSITADTFVITG